MEGRSRERWQSATRTRKQLLNPQKKGQEPTPSSSSFPCYSEAGQTSPSMGPRRGHTRIRPQQSLRETTPSVYYSQSPNYTLVIPESLQTSEKCLDGLLCPRSSYKHQGSLTLLFLDSTNLLSALGEGSSPGICLATAKAHANPQWAE